MPQYASEREFAFDATVLGFPSIQGCHAILYATATGLFGYHNVGGETPDKWPPITDAFLSFFRNHPNGHGKGLAIYGACYLSGVGRPLSDPNGTAVNFSQRAYGGDRQQAWIAELTAFADALRFRGPIFGHDLGAVPGIGGSAYVEFAKVGDRCVAQVKTWDDAHATSSVPPPTPDLRRWVGAGRPLSALDKITTTAVAPGGLRTIYPQRLR